MTVCADCAGRGIRRGVWFSFQRFAEEETAYVNEVKCPACDGFGNTEKKSDGISLVDKETAAEIKRMFQ
jgi:hypothetical protein